MEKKVTMKSTKQEIMDAYEEALKTLDAQKVEGDDPEAEAHEKKKKKSLENAESAVSAGIFSNDIIEKYNAVMMAIDVKNTELKELYGIAAKANSIAAMINAEKKLSEGIKAERENKKAEYELEICRLKEQIANLVEEFDKKKLQIDEQERDYHAYVLRMRAREEEEYTYNTDKNRAREKESQEEEKAAFEEEMKKRQAEIAAGMEELVSKKEELEMLQSQVEQIPSLVAEAEKRGAAEKEKALVKQFGYEKAAIKSDYEHKIAMATATNENLSMDNQRLNQELVDLKKKLDDAYGKINTLAENAVKASSDIRIVDSTGTK